MQGDSAGVTVTLSTPVDPSLRHPRPCAEDPTKGTAGKGFASVSVAAAETNQIGLDPWHKAKDDVSVVGDVGSSLPHALLKGSQPL